MGLTGRGDAAGMSVHGNTQRPRPVRVAAPREASRNARAVRRRSRPPSSRAILVKISHATGPAVRRARRSPGHRRVRRHRRRAPKLMLPDIGRAACRARALSRPPAHPHAPAQRAADARRSGRPHAPAPRSGRGDLLSRPTRQPAAVHLLGTTSGPRGLRRGAVPNVRPDSVREARREIRRGDPRSLEEEFARLARARAVAARTDARSSCTSATSGRRVTRPRVAATSCASSRARRASRWPIA